jgi:hypothetical protein
MSQSMIRTSLFSRRRFVGTSAQAAAAGLLARTALPSSLLAAVASPWEAEGYNHKVVVRIYDPAVAADYTFGSPYYWRMFDTARLEAMLDAGIMQIASAATPEQAWKKILPGVSRSSRIVVKANMNNTAREWKAAALNTSPAMMIALTKSLNEAGIRNQNVTFLDCSRHIPDEMKADIWAGAEGVQLVAGPQSGSAAAQEMPYGGPYVIPQLVLDADFLISLHLMKKHDGGQTGAMKNFFGMKADGKVTFAHGDPGWMDGPQIRGIVTHPEIRKRLKLCINEAVLAANSPDTLDQWNFGDLFPGGRPSSLFLSRNPFLQDVVGWDFVRAECSRFPCRVGPSITWLKKCAGYLPSWQEAAIESGVLAQGAQGMPQKDMHYDPALVEYISRRV